MSSVGSIPSSSCDNQPLSALAKKIPQIKRSGDLGIDTRKAIERDAMVRIVDKLSKYPAYILPMHGVMMSQDFCSESSASQQEWTGNYKCVGKLPKGWIAEFLLARACELGLQEKLNTEVLQKVEGNSSHGLWFLFCFDMQMNQHISFPSPCHDKFVASQAFKERGVLVGNRLRKLVEGGIKSDGSLDFSTGGCFTLQFDDNKCTTVTHVNGEVAVVPEHVVITKKFTLHDNFLDTLARVELSPSKYQLADFFPDTAVFKGHILDKKATAFKEIAANIAKQMETTSATIAQGTVQVSASVLGVAAAKRSAENLLKARSKLQQKKETRKTTMTIKLS
jgi:hypothetical protein